VSYERDQSLDWSVFESRPADQQAVQFLGTEHEDTLSPGAINMGEKLALILGLGSGLIFSFFYTHKSSRYSLVK
jgi:hypothetical protein